MTVEQTHVVDIVAWRGDPPVVRLVVADHLGWDDERAHLLLLQAKLDTYLAFVEGGQLAEAFPAAAGHAVVIEVAFLHEPPDHVVRRFLEPARRVILGAGFDLAWRIGTAEA